jgi:nicotinamidase-related amidase
MAFTQDLKALLVIDMQADALPPNEFAVVGMDAVVDGANRSIEACREVGVPLIFTRHHQLQTFLGLGSWSGIDAVRESEGRGELCPGLDFDAASDQVLFKQRWSAFAYTDLDLRLALLPGSQIALCGVVTDGCVQETAYDAFDRELRVILIGDAIGANTEGEHKAGMLGMANWLYGCRITDSHSFAKWLTGAPYEGWAWTQAHEFPYTTDSFASEYERLIQKASSAGSRAAASA